MPTYVALPGVAQFKEYLVTRPEPIRDALREWVQIYSNFVNKRFLVFSAGGGNWAPLLDSTIERKGHNAILIDSEVMFKNLDPKMKALKGVKTWGAIVSMELDFGGGAIYDSGVAVATVIKAHQEGTATLPQRKIFDVPDQETRILMAERLKRGIISSAFGNARIRRVGRVQSVGLFGSIVR